MVTELLSAYLPMDRRQALASGVDLPVDTTGSALLADISGFTPLTEALVAGLGPRRGAEELTQLLNTVYTALVSRVHHFGGSIVCFIGDALVSVFPDDRGLRGLACGLQMQRAMKQFQAMSAPQGGRVSLGMKAAVAVGPLRRFVVGDPEIQLMDVLAGATVDRLAEAEHLAKQGEVIAAPEAIRNTKQDAVVEAWRGRFGVVGGLRTAAEPSPWVDAADDLNPEWLRPYLLVPVHERVQREQAEFLAELRPVSVLFLRFTGIHYDEDPAAGEKLDAFTAWVQGVADRYGGYVLLLTTADKGSHLYIVFGALEAHEDDRQRAVAAAMRLAKPPTILGFISGVQIGVSHGRARVGAYGGETRRTYGALGDAVNLASRLMAVAPIGEIRCSESIYEAAKGRWVFDTLPSVVLKGMEEPQPVYRPRGRERGHRNAMSSKLIGRRGELAVLKQGLNAAKGGERRILFVEGEAGIGKSRLVEEIVRSADAAGFVTLLGAADSIEQHTPYRSWRDLLRSFFAIDEAMEASQRNEQVLQTIGAIDPTYIERAALLNDILGIRLPESDLTRSYTSEVRQESLAALVGDLLVHRSEEAPLVLVIEDTHWLDSLSWKLAVSVARSLSGCAAALLLTHRPYGDVAPAMHSALSAMSGAERLPLGPLEPGDTAELAAARFDLDPAALPEQVVALLTERAEGNPFFAVELIGALRDQDLLMIEGGACRVVGDPSALREKVPGTLEGVVLSRLDRLPVEEQLTVKVASVIGRSFAQRTVRSIYPSPIDETTLRAHLDHTSRRRLTVLEAEQPEPSFAFQHAVTHHVTYDTLLFEQRRELHRRVAVWYEETYDEELDPYVPLLAVHWRRAGHAEKECAYSRWAGEQAAIRHANAEAEIYFSRALELIDARRDGGEPNDLEALLRQRARTLGLLGRVEDERSDLVRLLELADAFEDVEGRAEILLLWSGFCKRCGQFDEAKGHAEFALVTMEETGNLSGRARAMARIADALEGKGAFHEAREAAAKALDAFRAVGDRGGQATSLKSLGITCARLGQLPQALERFREARELYRRLGDRKGEADILGNLGALNYYLGEYERCIEYTEQAQPLFHEMGNRIGSAKCLTNLGNSYSALGAFADGLEHHRRGLELYVQLEDANGQADSLCNIGIALAAHGIGGQPDFVFRTYGEVESLVAAKAATDEARSLYEEIGSQRGLAITAYNSGLLNVCLGDPERAERELHGALQMGRESELERLTIRALSALARSHFVAGNLEQALRFSADALESLGDDHSPVATEIRYTQYRILKDLKRYDEAIPHLETAWHSIEEQAERIRDDETRNRFLGTYQEMHAEWAQRRTAS